MPTDWDIISGPGETYRTDLMLDRETENWIGITTDAMISTSTTWSLIS
jgi:hypothetical protein